VRVSLQESEFLLPEKGGKDIFCGADIDFRLIDHQDIQPASGVQSDYRRAVPDRGRFSDNLVVAYHPASRQSEMVRGIRSQIMLQWHEQSRKSLLIVSPQSGDGRSFIASNLAVAFSQLDLRTLLIDADFRRPSHHAIFALSDSKSGLAEILAGQAHRNGIQGIAEFPSLSVLTAGSPPPNPAELFGSYRMNALLHILEARFDVLLIDTPAATSGIDAQVIAGVVGGAILLTRRNQTRLADAKALQHVLNAVQCPLMGAVVNDF
jgi:receptor protein-tyrosine kinase